MNRSVTVYTQFANEVANRVGGIVNGTSFKCPDGTQGILVTVTNREKTLKNTAEFKKLKREGKLISWKVA